VITSILNSFRLVHTGYVLAREGVFSFIDANAIPPLAKPALAFAKLIARKNTGDRAERLTLALGKLGPSHVKFGQFMATRPDIVGIKFARDLESLQDRMPAFDDGTARAIIAASLGQPVETLFTQFGAAVAAASIAQVHKAHSGTSQFAVKVLRPDVASRFKKDLSSFYFVARFAEKFVPAAARLKPVGIVDTLARSVTLEMDLRLEAAALSEMRENTSNDTGIRIPKPDWERTGRDVLTMEWIDGIPLSDIDALKAAHIDLPQLAKNVIQSFLRHAIRDGFFHADMHQGNLFADKNSNLVLIDFGIMGRIGLKERRFLAEILYGFITRNYLRVAQVHFEAGYVPAHHSVETFAQAIRAIGEPIHSLTADQISMAKLFTLLFEITDMFDMQTRTELVMLQKTMVVVEGVARNLDPKLNMWATAEPVVRDWIERNLGPLGKIAEFGEGAFGILSFAPHLPHLLARGEKLLSDLEQNVEHGFSLTASTTKAIGKAEARGSRLSAIALWIIAGLLAFGLFHG
jgi:ubiquinone biosynthesis protein